MKVLFVDDEANVLSGLKRMLRKLAGQWTMQFVGSGREALELLARESFDVIVSDVRMPGMDGVELLAKVQERHPEMVRIILSGHAAEGTMVRAAGPAHQCLSKPCDSDQLQATVGRAMALRCTMKDERLQRAVARLTRLPSLPALYERIMAELRGPDPSIMEVGKVVSQDLAMSAKVLQLVNSSFFGLAMPMTDPKRAVVHLGIDTIRSLALQTGVFDQLRDARFARLTVGLHVHSIQTGLAAKAIAEAEKAGRERVDFAFQVGLLHDIGWLVLAANLPDDCARIESGLDREAPEVLQREKDRFGLTHAEIGGYLLGIWGLPDQVVEGVMFHHEARQHVQAGFDVTIAVQFADQVERSWRESGVLPARETILVRMPHLDVVADRIPRWLEACQRALSTRE